MKVGFIGLGFIGSAYAANYEKRNFPVVRYGKGESHRESKKKLAGCDIVFIAVPTPTTPKGFNTGVVREMIKLVAPGKIAVIKSTILPGTTESIQEEHPDIFVMHAPEFLSEATAQEEANSPARNIIGIPVLNDVYRAKAELVLKTLPRAPYERICHAREAEMAKYAKNTLGYLRVLHTNILYDLSEAFGVDWNVVREVVAHDPDNLGARYLDPIHKSGRGAGGSCYIKDFEAFLREYGRMVRDPEGVALLKAARDKNMRLLHSSGKDLHILRGVYGRSR